MHYEGNIIRPPSEANSILLQITVGCSRNKCTFCGTYTNQRFKIKSDKIISNDIEFASKHFKYQKRIFLCDGDAMIVPQKQLLKIISEINKKLPYVNRIGTYANVKSLQLKTVDDLIELKKHGMGIIYLGLETGDDITLKSINKGTSYKHVIEVCKKIKSANIKLSVTVLLGIASKERSIIHAKETGRILSEIDPEYVGALSLILIPGTKLYNEHKIGKFKLLEPIEMLKELRIMIDKTNLSQGLFHANHASNYLPIRSRMPEEKLETIKKIDAALMGKTALKPERLRAL